MKKILLTFITIITLYGCSKGEENSNNEWKDITYVSEQEKFYGFKVKDKTGISIPDLALFEINNDENLRGLSSFKNGKVWIALFDANTKEQIFEWTCEQEFVKERESHVSIINPEPTKFSSDQIIIMKFIYKENSCQFLLTNKSHRDPMIGVLDLYFINNNEPTKIIREAYGNELFEWTKNAVMFRNGDRYWRCFDNLGNLLYEITFIQNSSPINNFDERIITVFDDLEKCLSFSYDNFFYIRLINVKEEQELWKVYLRGYEGNPSHYDTVDLIVDKIENNIYYFTLKLSQNNGTTYTSKFNINILTGDYELIQ